MTDRPPPRLGRLELLGAWLRIWTPPRGAVIPPVPWRRFAAIGAVAVAGIVALVLLTGQDQGAAQREQRAEAARHEAFLESVDRIQRPRHGRGERDPGATASSDARTTARTALLTEARSAIHRSATAAADKPIEDVVCEPFPRTVDAVDPVGDVARRAAAYDCTAVTSRFGTDETAHGVIGDPFRLVVHFRAGTFAFCRIVPLGDRDRLSHPLPAACATPDA